MYTSIASALAAPGWSMLSRRRWHGLALLGVGIVAPVALALYAVGSNRNWVALTLDATFLSWVIVLGALALIARIAALADVWFAAGRPIRFGRLDSLVGIVAIAAVAAGGVE